MTPPVDDDENPTARDRELVQRVRDGDNAAGVELQEIHAGLIEHCTDAFGHGLDRTEARNIAATALHETTLVYDPDHSRSSFGGIAYYVMRQRLREARDIERGYRGRLGADRQLGRALDDVMPAWVRGGLNPRDPTEAELSAAATRCGMTVEAARAILDHQRSRRDHRGAIEDRETTADDDYLDDGDELWTDPGPDPATLAIMEGRTQAVGEARKRLPARLRTVVDRYYPMTGTGREPEAIAAIGAGMGLSREGARKLLLEALALIRRDSEVQAWR